MHVQARWYSFHFLVQQLVGALVRLRILPQFGATFAAGGGVCLGLAN